MGEAAAHLPPSTEEPRGSSRPPHWRGQRSWGHHLPLWSPLPPHPSTAAQPRLCLPSPAQTPSTAPQSPDAFISNPWVSCQPFSELPDHPLPTTRLSLGAALGAACPASASSSPHAHLCTHSYHRLNALHFLSKTSCSRLRTNAPCSQLTSCPHRRTSPLLWSPCQRFSQGLPPGPLSPWGGGIWAHFLSASHSTAITATSFSVFFLVAMCLYEDPHPLHKPPSRFYKGSDSSSPALLPTAPWTAHLLPCGGLQSLAALPARRRTVWTGTPSSRIPCRGQGLSPAAEAPTAGPEAYSLQSVWCDRDPFREGHPDQAHQAPVSTVL